MNEPDQDAGRDELHGRLESALSDQYTLDREVGRGGMGVVYRATDIRLKRDVAIKVLPPELAFRSEIKQRFLREAISAAQLSHPNIVPIYAVDERDGLVYFAMGFIEGENLGHLMARRGSLPVEDVRVYMRQISSALSYAHERGVVHRDIKPDNIIRDSRTGRVMVTDFGIARALSDVDSTRLTATGVAIGTPAYMSPEQCVGDVGIDGRSDLYSLGVVAYQMLAGEPPFQAGTTPAMLIKQFSETPVDLRSRRSDVPPDLAALVMRLLEKNPAHRPASGAELLLFLDGKSVLPPLPGEGATPGSLSAGASVPSTAGRSRTAHDTMAARGQSTAATQRAPLTGASGQTTGTYGRSENAPAERDDEWFRENVGRRKPRKLKFSERPLAERVKITRAETLRVAFSSLFFFVINMVTFAGFPWFVFPVLGMGMGVWGKIAGLLAEGLRFRDIFGRNAINIISGQSPALQAARATSEPTVPDGMGGSVAEQLLAGSYGESIRCAALDLQNVKSQVERLSPSDRAHVPDVLAAAEGLYQRVITLAGALSALDADVDSSTFAELDSRIDALASGAAHSDASERKLQLLRKQRGTLQELNDSRERMFGQFESAGLMLQNLSLDVLRLRSAGVQNVMHQVNSATQEARALVREIGNVIEAADEIRSLDSDTRGER